MAIDPEELDGSGDEVAASSGVFEIAVLAFVAEALRQGVPAFTVRRRLNNMARVQGAEASRLADKAVERAWRKGQTAALVEIAEVQRNAPAVDTAAASRPTSRPTASHPAGSVDRRQAAALPTGTGGRVSPVKVLQQQRPNTAARTAAKASVDTAKGVMARGVQQAAVESAVRMTGVYERIVREMATAQMAGEASGRTVMQRALNEWAKRGLPAFTDKAGRVWSNQAYVEMLTRTVTMRAYNDAAHATLQAEGYDLVIASSHRNPAPMCQPYELKVLSLSGRSKGMVTVPSGLNGEPTKVEVFSSMADAEAAGYHHPHCRHSETLFVPDVTRPSGTKPDPVGYEATQRQRAMERKIREWKRREAIAEGDDAAYAHGKVREWQGKVRTHIDKYGLDRKYHREAVMQAAS